MSSKSRGGLSKREYAAKQAGGTLNYKTGKISIPSKSSSSKSSAGASKISYSSPQNDGEIFVNGQGFSVAPERQDTFLGQQGIRKSPITNTYSYTNPLRGTPDVKTSSNKKSSSSSKKSSQVNTSQRTSAAKVLGASTSKPNIVASNPTSLGKGLQWLNETLGYGYGKLTGAENPMLGLSQQVMGGDRGWTEKLQDILGTPVNAALRDDYETGGDYRNPQTISAINPWEVGTEAEDRARSQQIAAGNINPTTNYGTGFTTGYNNTGRISDDVDYGGNNDDNRRTSSRPVSNPIFQPSQSSNISDILKGGSPQSTPARSPQSAPDYSAGQITNPTRRQFLGNGLLSKGTYGNGAGNYGIEGAINSDMDNTNFLDDLLILAGIKPQVAYAAEKPSIMNIAQASENPQSSYELHQTTNPLPGITPDDQIEYINGVPFWKDDNSQTKYDAYENQVKNLESQLPPEEVAWANSHDNGQISNQSNTMAFNNIGYNSNPAVQQYKNSIKGFKTQEKDTQKAYKKALSEMLKGIEAQYAQYQAAGESDLNKQKVNDLQALASRFSFGLNQDPNSEQAIQYQQRTANDYAGQLTDFLAKLAAAKTQDIASARSSNQSNLASALGSIANQRTSAQQNLANLLYQMQQDSYNNALKNKPNLYQMATRLKNQGNNWGNIAYQLGNAGFDLTPGNENSKSLDAIMTGQVPQKAANLVSIGNGYVMDKTTGDVFQAYDPNNV